MRVGSDAQKLNSIRTADKDNYADTSTRAMLAQGLQSSIMHNVTLPWRAFAGILNGDLLLFGCSI